MRHALYVSVAVAVFVGTANAQFALPEPFISQLNESGMVFRETLFNGCSLAPIVANRHMDYELALASKSGLLEIRYAIRRYDPSPKGTALMDSSSFRCNASRRR